MVKVQDEVLVLDIADKVRVKVNRSAISEVKREAGAETSNAKAESSDKAGGDNRKKA